ncbi:MAG: hypothetical protein PHI41_06705 [Erysipelotrichaceae bacterium]|nr:hypothetical protein [Erysipelotrichaceae bacterium]
MIYYLVAIGVFSLYIIYDINSVTIKNHWLDKLFLLASVIFTITNVVMIFRLKNAIAFTSSTIVLIGCALIFLSLLIYTLFFALPFEATYVSFNQTKTIRTGMYGLSRHIGVLWFILMYVCLIFVFNDFTFTLFASISSLMNLIYIVIQDNFTFVRVFWDYQEYKQEVPFLIPTYSSVKRVILKGENYEF